MRQKDLEDGSDINIVFVVVVLKKTEDVNIFIGSDRVRQHVRATGWVVWRQSKEERRNNTDEVMRRLGEDAKIRAS